VERRVILCGGGAEARGRLSRGLAERGLAAVGAEGPEAAFAAALDGAAGAVVLLDPGPPDPAIRRSLAALRGPRFRVGVIVVSSRPAEEVPDLAAFADGWLTGDAAEAQLADRLVALLAPFGAASPPEAGTSFAGLIAGAPSMRAAVTTAGRAAAARIPVLLLGESGTGKERFARAIHEGSPRARGPFVAVNCGALPEALAESLLFGHEKGAFTGAESRHGGKFREAHGGTIFLDEVGELPPPVQVKLLRVLQEGEVDPVGGRAPVKVDVRVVSATNRDPRAEIAAGRFREDLYFRLAGVEIVLPSLRQRREDIAELALAHAREVARIEGRRFDGFAPEAAAWLAVQPWPGNVRELQNAVHRAMVLSEGPVLPLAAFVDHARRGTDLPEPPPRSAATGRIRTLAEVEAEAIADALVLCGGRIAETARKLGIGRSTLYRKMAEYRIAPTGLRHGGPP
jgi:DNA-binding NtrC family response regulator